MYQILNKCEVLNMKTTPTENRFDTLVANDEELNKSNIIVPINYDDDDDMEDFVDTVCEELFDMA